MMHPTSESDITSIVPSSSASPNAYNVQSPPRDSHDDIDKCSSSNGGSPLDSSSDSRHSTSSTNSSTTASLISGNRRRWSKHYCNVVPEEGGGGYDDDDYYGDRAYSRQCHCLIRVMAFGLVFTGICLVVWGAGRSHKAEVSIKSLRIQNLYFGEGSDHTGVPTKLISVNCSASLDIYNPARFYGIHVTSHTANLIYSQITVATGQLKNYYQPRKSRGIVWVRVVGREVPLYGAGMALAASDQSGGIPFKLEFEIQSIGYLLGKLVKTKHTTHFSCLLVINSKRTKQIIFQQNYCKYV